MQNPSPKPSPSVEQIPLPADYEAPFITTYTESELLNALGPAHAGDYKVENFLGIPGMPGDPP